MRSGLRRGLDGLASVREFTINAKPSRSAVDRILRIYVEHYNRRRPHRGPELQAPESPAPVEETDSVPDIERRALLGGLVNEYATAA